MGNTQKSYYKYIYTDFVKSYFKTWIQYMYLHHFELFILLSLVKVHATY